MLLATNNPSWDNVARHSLGNAVRAARRMGVMLNCWKNNSMTGPKTNMPSTPYYKMEARI